MQGNEEMTNRQAGDSRAATGACRPWRRVLVFRSARLPQVTQAIGAVRALSSHAEVWVLTQAEFTEAVRDAGADRVVTHTATRLGVRALGVSRLRQLRRLGCDAVVIPMMAPTLTGSENLLRLAAAVDAPEVVLAPGGAPIDIVDRRVIRSLAVARTLALPEPVVVLGQMLRALLTPRVRRPAPGGRTRVLHIINSLGLGGAQRQCAELVNRTPLDTYDVSVLVLADDGDFSRARFTRPHVTVEVLRQRLGGGTPIDAIRDYCLRGQYDVVHTWLPLPNMYGSAAARLAGVPRVVTSVRSFHPGHYPNWCQWWFRPADVLATRLASAVTVNATPLIPDLARWALFPSRRIRVVYNGLDPEPLTRAAEGARRRLVDILPDASDLPLVGIVGRLSEEKGQAVFLRMIAAVRAAGGACHGVVIGDGPCDGELRALARDLGIAAHVTFLGARQDATALMAGLDVLVLSSRCEGFPNVVLEAALIGVPVLASGIGGVLDMVTDTASLFPPGDVAAGARALARMLAAPDAARESAARLRARCRDRFTADRMVGDWLELYHAGEPRPLRRACAQPDATAWCTLAEGDR